MFIKFKVVQRNHFMLSYDLLKTQVEQISADLATVVRIETILFVIKEFCFHPVIYFQQQML